MSGPFPNLEAACGGKINPDTLKQFQKAMREYEEFMAGLSVMLAPKKESIADRAIQAAVDLSYVKEK